MIDSSIAVKWFSNEEETDKALAIMNQHVKGSRQLWVSDLLFHEVANALRYKPGFGERKLNQAMQSLFMLHLNTRPADATILENAAAIAYKGDVTIYDAVPVALAKLRKTICLTADENTQLKRLNAHGYPVALLSTQ